MLNFCIIFRCTKLKFYLLFYVSLGSCVLTRRKGDVEAVWALEDYSQTLFSLFLCMRQ